MKVMPCIFLFFLLGAPLFSQRQYHYWVCDEESGKKIGSFTRVIKQFSSGRTKIVATWRNDKEMSSGRSEYLVDAKYGSIRWRFVCKDKNGVRTDYRGERKGNLLLFKGVLKGRRFSKQLKIDSLPLYNNPAIGLQSFARSKKEDMEFLVLHPYKLKVYTMKAIRQKREIISLRGKKIKAVRVKWRLTGLLALFHSQVYWFRAADGVFLKSEADDDEYHILVGEKQ